MNILNLPTLNVLEVKENELGDYRVMVETVSPPSLCPQCGFSNIYKHGIKKQLFMDLAMHGKRVGIVVERQRYICRECSSTFFEPLSDMDEKRLATKRLITWIEEQSLKRTFVSIADEVGVDEKTIRNIFRDYVNYLAEVVRFETPQYLGIDEIHLLHKPRCVMTNIEENTIIDLLQNRNKDTVIRRLSSLPNKEKIKVVAMDMWKPYKDAVKVALPQAMIVIDKFHVVRMANEAMEKARKSLRAGLERKQKRQLMRDRYVLLKRNKDLEPKDQLLLDVWTLNFPTLKKCYDLKEGFFEIWDNDNIHDAYKAYDVWRAGITDDIRPHFQPLLTAVSNWEEEIFNYFLHPVTNAYTESLNSIIRVVNRLGRGYSLAALRAKILYTEGFHKTKRTSYRNTKVIGRLTSQPLPDFSSLWGETNDPNFNLGVDISTLVSAIEEGLI